jgi:hypothetical protein
MSPIRPRSAEELRQSLEKVKEQMKGLEGKLSQLKVEADSLEEARKLIRAQTPAGSEVLSEEEIADGKQKTITTTGKTLEEAFSKGRAQVPKGYQLLRQDALTSPSQRIITVRAFDENEAKEKARRAALPEEEVQGCRMVAPARSRFLGLGRKPALYEISVFEPATVEIVAKGKASVRATVGEKHVMEEIIRLRGRASELNSAMLRSSAPESRASSSPVSSRPY